MNRDQDWSAEEIRDYLTLHEDGREYGLSAALAVAMCAVGIGRLTEATFSEVVTRIRTWEEVNGFFWISSLAEGHKPTAIPTDAIYRRIGMHARLMRGPVNKQQFAAMIKRDRLQKELHEAEQKGRAKAEEAAR